MESGHRTAFTDVEEKNFDTLEYGIAHSTAAARPSTWTNSRPIKDINGDGAFNYLDVAKLYNMLRNQNT